MKKKLIFLTILLLCNTTICAEIKPFNKKETKVVSEKKLKVDYVKINHQIKAPEKEEKITTTDFNIEKEKRKNLINELLKEEAISEEKTKQDNIDKQQEKTSINKNNKKNNEVKKETNKQQKVKKQINNKTTINQCLNCGSNLSNNMFSCPQCGIAIDWEKIFLQNKIMITEKLKKNKYKCVNCGKKISKYSYTCPKCKTIIDWDKLFL